MTFRTEEYIVKQLIVVHGLFLLNPFEPGFFFHQKSFALCILLNLEFHPLEQLKTLVSTIVQPDWVCTWEWLVCQILIVVVCH